ncbi:hypothetical protein VDGE_30038 [Verticillium dahliae]|uniref:Uncharacterized protein n=1 Tax=Verticillium dahliae TaxID=27337 RepID=A0A444RVG6_VERDA|nr:hypothetical protein VDGE_30038 [Verticillium dahliae]
MQLLTSHDSLAPRPVPCNAVLGVDQASYGIPYSSSVQPLYSPSSVTNGSQLNPPSVLPKQNRTGHMSCVVGTLAVAASGQMSAAGNPPNPMTHQAPPQPTAGATPPV